VRGLAVWSGIEDRYPEQGPQGRVGGVAVWTGWCGGGEDGRDSQGRESPGGVIEEGRCLLGGGGVEVAAQTA